MNERLAQHAGEGDLLIRLRELPPDDKIVERREIQKALARLRKFQAEKLKHPASPKPEE
jgi:hypothetical protein